MAFISLLDDRARPKGSRDPLGFELIWTYFGRKVVGNLTTITSSLENFTVALLGFHWANELVEQADTQNRQDSVQKYFLRYEQLAAYLRFYCGSGSIMGKNRVLRRIADENHTLPIDEKKHQILSNQASYGLWGLYSSALRDTGLIEGNERKITSKGQIIINLIEEQLDKQVYIDLFTSSGVNKKQLEVISTDFVDAINTPAIRQKLLVLLLEGAGGNKLQSELWSKTEEIIHHGKLPESSHGELSIYLDTLFNNNISSELKQALDRIINIERILTAVNNIFHYCRMKDGESLTTIIKALEDKQYGYDWLVSNLNGVEFPRKDHLEEILIALKQNDYKETIRGIFQLNKTVMSERGGAPWVEIDSGEKVRVTVKSETGNLEENPQSLQKRWDYEYFLKSYLFIARNYQSNNSSGSAT